MFENFEEHGRLTWFLVICSAILLGLIKLVQMLGFANTLIWIFTILGLIWLVAGCAYAGSAMIWAVIAPIMRKFKKL